MHISTRPGLESKPHEVFHRILPAKTRCSLRRSAQYAVYVAQSLDDFLHSSSIDTAESRLRLHRPIVMNSLHTLHDRIHK